MLRTTDTTRVHDDHELAWVAHGWAQFWVDAQTFVADAHHAVWIPRHHEHWLERGDDALVLPIWLTPTPSVEVPASPKLIARNATLDTLVRTCLQPGLIGESRVRDAGLALQQGVAAAAGR